MYNLSGVDVFIKDRTPDNIDDNFVFKYISTRVPFHLARNIDIIYVGQFPEMAEREIDAYFEDGAIFVTNEQEEEMDMIDDIVHELAHAVELNNEELIYGSSRLQSEFKAKRRNLHTILQSMYDIPEGFLNDIDYNKEIDNFLFRTVGYDILNQLVANIFISGYAATSVSEYFARGFEEYFIGDRKTLRQLSPVLYKIIENLVHLED